MRSGAPRIEGSQPQYLAQISSDDLSKPNRAAFLCIDISIAAFFVQGWKRLKHLLKPSVIDNHCRNSTQSNSKLIILKTSVTSKPSYHYKSHLLNNSTFIVDKSNELFTIYQGTRITYMEKNGLTHLDNNIFSSTELVFVAVKRVNFQKKIFFFVLINATARPLSAFISNNNV